MPKVLALGRLKQENHKANLGSMVEFLQRKKRRGWGGRSGGRE